MAEKKRETQAINVTNNPNAFSKNKIKRIPQEPSIAADLSKIFWSIKVNWSGIAAGSLTAIALQLLLSSASSFIGLEAMGVSSVSELQNVFPGYSLWIVFCSLISAFVGSYISSRISGNRYAIDGLVTGIFVWAILIIAGVISNYFGTSGLVGYGDSAVNVLRGIAPSGFAVSVDEVKAAADIAVVQARYFFIGSFLSLITAVFGGWLASEKRSFPNRKASKK
jgi:hypothetical protein